MSTVEADVCVEQVAPLDPVEAARALRPLLEKHAEACDRERRIQQPVFEAMRDAGLFKISMPKRAGGLGMPFIKQIEASAELGQACASSAWVQLVYCATTGGAGMSPPDLVQSLFKTGNETVCGVVMRNGKARPVEGGYIVSGKWPFASGCLHADWGTGGIEILDENGGLVGPGWVYLPLRGEGAARIEDTWHVAGMRGTGSNTIVADEMFVPGDLVVPMHKMRAQVAPEDMEPSDRWPPAAYFGLGLTGPLLGAAQAILNKVSEKIHSRPVTYWKYAHQSDSHVILKAIGDAQMEIDSAWLHVRYASSLLDEVAQHRPLTTVERVQIPANCGYAMSLLRRAGERLMDIAGSSGFADGSPLERAWRDINFASRHAAFNTAAAIECYGRALAGMELNMTEPPKQG